MGGCLGAALGRGVDRKGSHLCDGGIRSRIHGRGGAMRIFHGRQEYRTPTRRTVAVARQQQWRCGRQVGGRGTPLRTHRLRASPHPRHPATPPARPNAQLAGGRRRRREGGGESLAASSDSHPLGRRRHAAVGLHLLLFLFFHTLSPGTLPAVTAGHRADGAGALLAPPPHLMIRVCGAGLRRTRCRRQCRQLQWRPVGPPGPCEPRPWLSTVRWWH